jgi:predicted transposase YbfD/YdcC
VGKYNLTLGQVRTSAHSNEIRAIPELLDLIEIKGARIRIDAMGCQKAIAEKIIEKEADYLLAVKENQRELYHQIKEYFDWEESEDWGPETVEVWESGSEKDHGRIERRECAVAKNIDWLYQKNEWKGVKRIIRSRLYCIKKDKNSGEWLEPTVNDRYYISSLDISAEETGKIIREHWSIENKLHWMLDVNFREDADQKKAGNAPANMNVLRKSALSRIRNKYPDGKESIKRLKFKAMMHDDFRYSLFFDS